MTNVANSAYMGPHLRGEYARTYAPCDDRMAGMSPPALCACTATRILPSCCRQAVASSSQIGDRNVGRCFPLEGESSTPPRRRTKPGPQGPGFLFGGGQRTDDGARKTVLPRLDTISSSLVCQP